MSTGDAIVCSAWIFSFPLWVFVGVQTYFALGGGGDDMDGEA